MQSGQQADVSAPSVVSMPESQGEEATGAWPCQFCGAYLPVSSLQMSHAGIRPISTLSSVRWTSLLLCELPR